MVKHIFDSFRRVAKHIKRSIGRVASNCKLLIVLFGHWVGCWAAASPPIISWYWRPIRPRFHYIMEIANVTETYTHTHTHTLFGCTLCLWETTRNWFGSRFVGRCLHKELRANMSDLSYYFEKSFSRSAQDHSIAKFVFFNAFHPVHIYEREPLYIRDFVSNRRKKSHSAVIRNS